MVFLTMLCNPLWKNVAMKKINQETKGWERKINEGE